MYKPYSSPGGWAISHADHPSIPLKLLSSTPQCGPASSCIAAITSSYLEIISAFELCVGAIHSS